MPDDDTGYPLRKAVTVKLLSTVLASLSLAAFRFFMFPAPGTGQFTAGVGWFAIQFITAFLLIGALMGVLLLVDVVHYHYKATASDHTAQTFRTALAVGIGQFVLFGGGLYLALATPALGASIRGVMQGTASSSVMIGGTTAIAVSLFLQTLSGDTATRPADTT